MGRFGLGYRPRHAAELAASDDVDWLEVVTENVLGVGGKRLHLLERARRDRPLALHGVSLGIAGSDPLDPDYLARLAALTRALEPRWVSDHLCWTTWRGRDSHDLLPVAYTQDVLAHVAARVHAVQEAIGRALLLENPSAYVRFAATEMDEATFLRELCRRTGAGVLLDVNNLVVNAANLGDDPVAWLDALGDAPVGYLHVAGHSVLDDVRVDTHDQAVPSEVWALYREVARRYPDAWTLIERDDHIPPLDDMQAELARAREEWHAPADAARPPVMPSPRSGRPGTSPATTSVAWPDLQASFFSRIVDRPLSFDHASDSVSTTLVTSATPVPGTRGLQVYSDAYLLRLCRALRANLPALAKVIGTEAFDAMATDFLRAHPPRSYVLAHVSAPLPAFVERYAFADTYGVTPRVLAELAALEQAQLEAQDAEDPAETPGVELLAALAPDDWETARFVFAPAVRIVRATHDVLPVIEAVAAGETPARPRATPTVYLVSRTADGDVETESLDGDTAAIFESLLAGGSLDAHDPETLATVLVGACREGLVVGVQQRDPTAESPRP